MNLRDQLVKAGLANKKQAKKAKNAARKARAEKRNKERQGLDTEDDIDKSIKAKQEAQKQKDRELNKQIEETRARQEKQAQIVDILLSHDSRVRGFSANVAYYFIVENQSIHMIEVTESQQKDLAKGRLGIVRGGPLDDIYRLVPKDQVLKLKELDSEIVACHHKEEEAA